MNRKLLAFCVGILVSAAAMGQTAGIIASPISGCNPLEVTFSDGSTGATSWQWTFGNGNSSTQQNPGVQIYINPGTYTVTLNINGGGGALTKTTTVTVNVSPFANFTASNTSGTSCFPLTENFTDNSTVSSGSITSWNWDFGDGTTSTLQNPTHVYTSVGSFPVALQVTSSNGCTHDTTKSNYIVITSGVTAGFTTVASSGCTVPITVNFNNTSTGPGTLTYAWTFGDGNTSTQTSPTDIYAAAGNYVSKLTVTSSSGCVDTISENIAIGSSNIVSSFTSPDSACINNPVTLVNTSNPNPVTSSWDFGDGTTSTITNPSKTYTTVGTYTIKLVDNFGGCQDSVTHQIQVLPAVVAGFKADDSVSCNPNFTVNFTDQSTSATAWLWSFGDGTTSNSENPSHTYSSYGSYSVTLTASNSTGCSGSFGKANYIQIVQPTVTITNLPLFGCAPLSFTPAYTDSLAGGVVSYLWNFGDGTTSTAANPPTHVYPAGSYQVTLTLTGVNGCTATTMDSVKAGTVKPSAAFTANPTTQCVDQGITFTDQSTGLGSNPNWNWDFGDMSSSTLQNPVHDYKQPGNFTVTEVVYNNGCGDTLVKNNIVINNPKAQFTYTANCAGGGIQFSFVNTSIGADPNAQWNFGDGTTYTGTTPPPYTLPGGVTSTIVTLTVTSAATGCSDTYQQTVSVPQAPQFVLSTTNTCKNVNVFLTVTNPSGALNPNDYYFNYGDGFTLIGSSYSAAHAYTKAGVYSVTVGTTTLAGCTDSVTAVNAVTVSGPTAQFSSNATGGCTGLAAVFTDLSTTDGVHNIVKWIFDYGDGTVQTYSGPPYTHNYTSQGIYSVKLTVIDASGCMDSIVKGNLIAISFPHAAFVMADSLSCPGTPIVFTNTSSGYGLTYSWNFGDGTTSTSQAPPPHNYLVSKDTVSLKVLDQYGCTDSVAHFVVVDTPHASFSINSILANCPPLKDTLTFTGSSYYDTIKWTFGDGGLSYLANPIHFYTIPGTYIDSLFVTSPGGCTSIAVSPPIQVFGPYGALSYSPLTGCHTLSVNFSVVTSNVIKYVWQFSNSQTLTTTTPTTSYTYDSAGKYLPLVILIDPTGCAVPVAGLDTILVAGSTPQFGYDHNVFCDSGTVQFSDSSVSTGPSISYLWNFGDGSTSTLENPSHDYTIPGLYTVTLYVTTEAGCVDSVVKTGLIKVVAHPQVDIGGINLADCQPGSQTFQGIILVPDTSILSWSWNFFNGNTSTAQMPPTQTYPNASTSDSVMVSVVNSSGCRDTVKKYFPIYPLPTTNAGIDTAVCVGGSVTLTATGANTYVWAEPDNSLSCTNCPDPIATPVATVTYVLTGSTAFGCTSSDSVTVKVITPGTISLSSAIDSICIGQHVQLIASGEAIYNWTPATGLNNPNISNPIASPDSTTTYQIVGADYKTCFADTQYVQVVVFNYPTIDAGPPVVTIAPGSTYQINATGSPDITTVAWTPSAGLSCTNCYDPVAKPTFTTTYTINATNNGGCSVSDSIELIVLCGASNLFVPNTFSPNGDGVNDIFYVRGKALSRIQSMLIFNRWGQVVFEKKDFDANDPTAGWDGTFNGKPAPIDVYIYEIEVICDNSQVLPYHGNVALIR